MNSICNCNHECQDGHCVHVQSNPFVMLLVFYLLYISKDSISNLICKSKKMLCSTLKYLWCKIMTTSSSATIACSGLLAKIQCNCKSILKNCISIMAIFSKDCICGSSCDLDNISPEPKCEEPEVVEIIKCDIKLDQNNKEEQENVCQDTIEQIKEQMDKAGAGIKEGFEDIAESIKDTIVPPVTEVFLNVKEELDNAGEKIVKFGQNAKEIVEEAWKDIKEGFEGIENMNCEEQKEVVETIKCDIAKIWCDIETYKYDIDNLKCDIEAKWEIIQCENLKSDEQKEVVETINCDIENIRHDIETIKCEIETLKCDIEAKWENTQCDPEPKCEY